MTWSITNALDVGGRQEQQDAFVCYSNDKSDVIFAVLADGMGGHHGGEIASQVICQKASDIWSKYLLHNSFDPSKIITDTILLSHSEIKNIQKEQSIDCQSTIAVLFLLEKTVYFATVGDSRIYGIKENCVARLTKDDSVTEMLLALGEIKEHEIATHPDQNKLTKSIGGVELPPVRLQKVSQEEYTAFLICSDGFWEVIREDEMSTISNTSVESLVNLAKQRGGKSGDNISSILVRKTT